MVGLLLDNWRIGHDFLTRCFTARKRSLGRLSFSPVCQSFCPQGEVGFPACTRKEGWLPSMHWEEGLASQHALGRGIGFPATTGKEGLVSQQSLRRGVCIQGEGSASRGRGLHPGGGVCIQVEEGSAFRGRMVCIQGEGSASRWRRGLHSGGGWSASRGRVLHPGGVCIQGVWADPPQDTWDTTGYGQRAGGIHPTGMHSCWSM